MKRAEHYFGLTLTISVLLFYILVPVACAPTKVKIYPTETQTEKTFPRKPFSGKTYSESTSQWTSSQDLVKWMEKDFSFDVERYKRFERTLPAPRTPEETFQLKSGIYIDAATFLKETLNRINPPYKAQIVILMTRPSGFNHYACSFKKDGKPSLWFTGLRIKKSLEFMGRIDRLRNTRNSTRSIIR